MTKEHLPTPEQQPDDVEITAVNATWLGFAARCEVILGGMDGKNLSQRTWDPDGPPDAQPKRGFLYALTLQLRREGQTEPNLDTTYTLAFNGREENGMYHLQPYTENPRGLLTGDRPIVMVGDDLQSVLLDRLQEFLDTYPGEQRG